MHVDFTFLVPAHRVVTDKIPEGRKMVVFVCVTLYLLQVYRLFAGNGCAPENG